MVTRRANGRQHEVEGERTPEREEESNNLTLRQILERVDQLQQQNQTLQQQNQTLQQQSQSLQTRMNALTRGQAEDVEAGLGEFHPFSPEIAEAQFLADFKEPRLKDYDGTTDPQDHVTAFKTQMLKKGVGDALQCKLFSGTLTAPVMAFEEGLLPGPFNESLAQRPTASMEEIRNGAACYIKGEESNVDKRENKWWEDKSGRKKDTFNSANYNSRQGRGFNGNDERFKSRYQGSWSTDRSREVDLTPLNASRTRILKDVYQSDLLKLPPPAKGAKGPDLNRWCDYHRAKGHDTENCWTLMNKIEQLIKEGGFFGGGETSSAWKKYVRSMMSVSAEVAGKKKGKSRIISFSDEDMKGIKPHEDNPMVIDIVMVKYKVQRVLMDQGSSTDILYWSTFQRLQIPQEWLLPFSGSLIGFPGDSVEVRGYVDVMTTFGEREHKKAVRVKYLVINAPSSYNIIIGRAALNSLGAVVSTVHLTMK
ncbi:hypothetical protein SESBI_19972 [Sesbania bispinosa]|nr:hypothetical protein SESBI_19972 [Sesbania bispinosa]